MFSKPKYLDFGLIELHDDQTVESTIFEKNAFIATSCENVVMIFANLI